MALVVTARLLGVIFTNSLFKDKIKAAINRVWGSGARRQNLMIQRALDGVNL